jgi:hypothetical protein
MECGIVRDQTSDLYTAEMRWTILKSMLDDFPELKERAEKYLSSRNALKNSFRDNPDLTIKELTEKAIHEYRRECNKKW